MKNFFLEEVVNYTFRKYSDLRKLSIIFPNRRAGLYFQKALSKKVKKPIWSPKVFTMEDFVQGFSNIKISDGVSDNILLNHYIPYYFFFCSAMAVLACAGFFFALANL